jgi:hypothetical protein
MCRGIAAPLRHTPRVSRPGTPRCLTTEAEQLTKGGAHPSISKAAATVSAFSGSRCAMCTKRVGGNARPPSSTVSVDGFTGVIWLITPYASGGIDKNGKSAGKKAGGLC